jgi:phospholipase C
MMTIEHVVIIVKENHTFDNYFGTVRSADGQQLGHAPNPPPADPLLDHLTRMHRAGDSRFHVQYTGDDIPDYFGYARNYPVCDASPV